MADRLDGLSGIAAIELNISCPNVSGGVDFGTDPAMCERLVADCRSRPSTPIIAKLTPNVTSIPAIAKAAAGGGADAISLINTCLGMAIDWRRRRPMLGNVMGGLSGPAIKPIALRAVYQAAQAVKTPIIGIGGIATIDDVMEFFVAGATAVQLGTVNFYNPKASMEVLDALPEALAEAGVSTRCRYRRHAGHEVRHDKETRRQGDRRIRPNMATESPCLPVSLSPHASRHFITIETPRPSCASSAAFNPPARSTGATTSARSASTSPCRTTSRRFISSPICTR